MKKKEIKLIMNMEEIIVEGLPTLKINCRFTRERSDTEIIIKPVDYYILKNFIEKSSSFGSEKTKEVQRGVGPAKI